jgi:hypothetical protein
MALVTKLHDEQDFHRLVNELIERFDLERELVEPCVGNIWGLNLDILQMLYGVLPMFFFDRWVAGMDEASRLRQNEDEVFQQIVLTSPVSRVNVAACRELFFAKIEHAPHHSFWCRRSFRQGASDGVYALHDSMQFRALVEITAAILIKRNMLPLVHVHLANEVLIGDRLGTRAQIKRLLFYPEFGERIIGALKSWAARPESGTNFYEWFVEVAYVPKLDLSFIERQAAAAVQQLRQPPYEDWSQFLEPGSDSLAAYYALTHEIMLRFNITRDNFRIDD